MRREIERCMNRNHGRPNAPVRCCPDCGEVVNQNIPVKRCSEGEHAQSRKRGSRFCIDCGKLLRAAQGA